MNKKIISAVAVTMALCGISLSHTFNIYNVNNTPFINANAENVTENNVITASVKLGVNESVPLKEILGDNYYKLGSEIIESSYNVNNPACFVYSKNSYGVSETRIYAVNTGNCTITAADENGTKVIVNVSVYPCVEEISLSKSNITLCKGEIYTLKYKVNSGAYSYRYTYTSSDSNVVSVDENGRLIPKAVGKATIKIHSYNGYYDTCVVTVKNPPSKITLNVKKATLGAGQKLKLKAQVPKDSLCRSIVFSSSKKSVCQVNPKTGIVTAKKNGTALITVKTHNGKTAVCRITVKKAPSKIKFTKKIVALKKGRKYSLKCIVPKGSLTGNYKFYSHNPEIASVDLKTGKVTAKKSGVAVIGVKTYNGKKAYCKIAIPEKSDVKVINSCTIKDTPAFSGKTLGRIKKGKKISIISKKSRWYKVVYDNKIGYIYNKAIKNITNYTKINNKTFPAVVDDWFFINGTDVKTIYEKCAFPYQSLPKKKLMDMCVFSWKFKTGACYYHAGLLYYMLNRAGYDAHYVQGHSKRGPHAWVALKTASGIKHIDSTPNLRHVLLYKVPYSAMHSFGYTIDPQYNKYK